MEITLQEARRRICSVLSPLPAQSVALSEALSRCPVEDLRLTHPKPNFDQSTRDGFVVANPPGNDIDISSDHVVSYTVIGEIAAGSPCPDPLSPHASYRIMTGA
ncbi:MAG: hypothetical protein OEV64_03525, partial [Desulfobulbaceae bacterium]|nr:hypothetical protein [Desulfobulbaceae bacterium]